MTVLRTEDDLRTLFAEDAQDVCSSAEILSRVVGDRTRRRRHRWLPAVVACAVVVVVAVVIALTTSGGTSKQPTPPVANRVPASWHTVSYPTWDVTLKAPPDWRSYQYEDSSSFADLVGYLSTARLHDPCARTTTVTRCDQPISQLGPADVLVAWWSEGWPTPRPVSGLTGNHTVVGGRPAVVTIAPASGPCADLHGHTSVDAAIGASHRPNSSIAYQMRACLGADADESEVLSMLQTVRFVAHLPSDTFRGRLLAVGGPAPGTPRPLPGTVIVRSDDSRITVPVGDDGRYSVEIPPGYYEIEGHSPLYGDGKYLCRGGRPHREIRNETVTLNVLCQMP